MNCVFDFLDGNAVGFQKLADRSLVIADESPEKMQKTNFRASCVVFRGDDRLSRLF